MTPTNLLMTVAVVGVPIVTIASLILRVKKHKENTAGYIYNGKAWVAWLFAISFLGVLLILAMDAFVGDFQWGLLFYMLVCILMYLCYALMSYRPANEEEMAEARAEGKTVTGDLSDTAESLGGGILVTLGACLAALPGMLVDALNPVVAYKTISGVTYKVMGSAMDSFLGVVALVFAVLFVVFLVLAGLFLFAIYGTFAVGILAIIKFFLNLKYYR